MAVARVTLLLLLVCAAALAEARPDFMRELPALPIVGGNRVSAVGHLSGQAGLNPFGKVGKCR